MSELPNPEQTLPVELQQPPVFTDAEASAVLQAQADIAATRLDSEGKPAYREYIMGATYDGTVVSVDEWSGRDLTDDYFAVRVGSAAQLTGGTSLSEQKLAYESPNVMRLRDGGTTVLTSEFGTIGIPAPHHKGELPEFEGKVLFPIGEDGKPFSPAAKREAEAAAARVEAEKVQPTPSVPQPGQVSVGGIRKFLRRRK